MLRVETDQGDQLRIDEDFKMLSTSSPVLYPPSSSPANDGTNPPGPHGQKRRPRAKAGFVMDDDSDEEEATAANPPKRRMLSSPGVSFAATAIPELAEPTSPPIETAADVEESGATPTPAPAHEDDPQEATFDRLLDSGANLADVLQGLSCARGGGDRFKITTCSGKTAETQQRKAAAGPSYERIVAARSKTKEGRARRSYYGVAIQDLVEVAKKDMANEASAAAAAAAQPDHPMPSVEEVVVKKPKRSLLWTEKYRARSFMDLCGDDGTNRQVLRWLKRWDSLVFPHSAKSRPSVRRPGAKAQAEDEKPHRKILMLTGPPGLGKTTLAHVCAKQAGYDVMEINASDDRSRDVVKNRIRTSLGTESVKTVQHAKGGPSDAKPKIARPVCVVVDEVDGVVSGAAGSGDGGFVKALLDLIALGEKNAAGQAAATSHHDRRKRKGDDFRQMRPLILICNDVYHPSLRPLRQSSLAEVIHVGKPNIDAVVTRLKAVFEKEGIPCEKDAARKVCEAAWGISGGIDAKNGAESNAEGDLRGIMVVGEWVAGRVRSASLRGPLCLTRPWVDKNIVQDLAHGGGGARGIGRGSVRDIVSRVFQEGAGFPKGDNIVVPQSATTPADEQPQAQLGFSEQQRKYAMERLGHMVETSGDVDRVMTDIMADYPHHDFNDDSFLTKPDQAYDWMHFHDALASKLYGSQGQQSWELAPYLSQPVLACHHFFASPKKYSRLMYEKRGFADDDNEAPPLPFSGPRADFAAHEALKANRSMLQAMQGQLPPTLMRAFRSAEDVATDFVPYLVRLVSPDVKPVVVGGGGSGDQNRWTASVRKESEKALVRRAAETLLEVGVALQRGKIEGGEGASFARGPTWVYRMEPDIDALATFETSAAVMLGLNAPTRYAVRQVLDQEVERVRILRDNAARQSRFQHGNPLGQDVYVFDGAKESSSSKIKGGLGGKAGMELPAIPVKRDFFGRVVKADPRPTEEGDGNGQRQAGENKDELMQARQVWVTFHEGFSNAVRKPITLEELMGGM